MKKILIISMLLIVITSTFSQQNDPVPALTKQDYLKKSKNQKIAALSLLGGGIVIGSIGTIMAAKEVEPLILDPFGGEPPDDKQVKNGAALIAVGIISVLTSIPFFSASSKNKRKAASLSFKYEPAPQLVKNNFVYRYVPSLNLKISL